MLHIKSERTVFLTGTTVVYLQCLKSSEMFETVVTDEAGVAKSLLEQNSGVIDSCEQVIMEVKLSIQKIIQTSASTNSHETSDAGRASSTPSEADDGRSTGMTHTLHTYESQLEQQMSAFRLDRIIKSLSNLSREVSHTTASISFCTATLHASGFVQRALLSLPMCSNMRVDC